MVSACGGGPGAEIARVGDSVVTERDLADLYETKTLPVGQEFREAVFNLLAKEILIQGMMEEFGIGVDAADVERRFQELEAEMIGRDLTPEQALGVAGAGWGMVRFNAELASIRDTVTDLILSSPEFLDLLFEGGIGVTTVCARHLLVETREEAVDAAARIEAGEEFAAVADDVSLDSAPGGDLGCRVASAYVPQFAIATLEVEVGIVSEPVETDFGWHLLIVSERSAFDRAEVEGDPRRFVSDADVGAEWTGWLNDRLRAADVQLVERYGTWSPIGIRAPSG
jgi:parvulin-like peptidyl-prolyl isomerase